MENGLLIGEVATRSGTSRKALRLYEARGILPPSRRTAAGYRVYPAGTLGVLAFVQQGRRLGLTLQLEARTPEEVGPDGVTGAKPLG
jgi:DNA-binding transcriptional MerR regulator